MSKVFTLNELLAKPIRMVTEDAGHYYVKLDSDDNYDDSLWVVDKNTKQVTYTGCIDYMFSIHDSTASVELNDFIQNVR